MGLDVYALGNALVDIRVQVEDSFLAELGLEIIRSHNNRVLRELKLRGKRLESIDPDWQLLLPSGFLDALKE